MKSQILRQKKSFIPLEDEQKVVHDLSDKPVEPNSIELKEPEIQNDTTQLDYSKPTTLENENPLIQMNALLQDLEVAYEVVSYPVESREEPEAPQNVETEELLFKNQKSVKKKNL
jgi:hypothetical protein